MAVTEEKDLVKKDSATFLCRAIRKANGQTVEGYPVFMPEGTYLYVPPKKDSEINQTGVFYEIDPKTLKRNTGKHYMDGEPAYEGDVYVNPWLHVTFRLKYGIYHAWCPVDNCYLDGVGFYAEADGYPQMPVGNLEEYALKVTKKEDLI